MVLPLCAWPVVIVVLNLRNFLLAFTGCVSHSKGCLAFSKFCCCLCMKICCSTDVSEFLWPICFSCFLFSVFLSLQFRNELPRSKITHHSLGLLINDK